MFVIFYVLITCKDRQNAFHDGCIGFFVFIVSMRVQAMIIREDSF